MRAVNLLPKDAGRSAGRVANPVVIAAVGGGTALVAVLGVLFMTTSGTLATRQDELAARQVELAAVPRPAPTHAAVAITPEAAALAAARAPRVAAVSAALAERVAWDRVLRRFSLVLPGDVWLQTLALESPDAQAVVPAVAGTVDAAASGFTITGRTYSHAGVARLLSRMAAVPDLVDVQLQSSRLTDVGGQDLVEFTIVAGVRTDGGSS